MKQRTEIFCTDKLKSMINFIPIFPLALVVYPGEELNLHIFEPRYKELITECFAEAKPFGIPTVLEEGVAETGTMVEITEIVQVYEDGRMDIKTRGIRVFQVLELIESIPDKMFSGAIVSYPINDETTKPFVSFKILDSVYVLHRLLNVTKNFNKKVADIMSYDMAHHAGLSLKEEYELLCLFKEEQRLEYLRRHLEKVIPVITGMEQLKEKIIINGSFKKIKGFKLN